MSLATTEKIVHEHFADNIHRLEKQANNYIQHPYLVPTYNGPYSTTLFLWDHFFMSMRFAHQSRPEYYRYLIDNLLWYADNDGYVPNKLHTSYGELGETPRFHAQPFLMQSSLLYLATTGSKKWINEIWPKLEGYLHYYDANMKGPYGLYKWPMPHYSGMDNDVSTTFRLPDTVINPDINCWLYLDFLAATKIAMQTDKTDRAEYYTQKAKTLKDTVNQILWNEANQTYAAFDLCEGKHILHLEDPGIQDEGLFAYQSCSNLIPVCMRLAGEAQAQAVIEKYILSPLHFRSNFGIRSLSRSSSFYNNAIWGNPPRFSYYRRLTNANWQGPVWFLITYFVYYALRYHSYEDQAEQLRQDMLETMANTISEEGVLSENWDAETGKSLYAKGFGSWNILADIMNEQYENDNWWLNAIFS